MLVKINGEDKKFVAESLTVNALLGELNLSTDHIAVELNREIVPKLKFAEVKVCANDAVEIVQFVGGG